LSTSLLATSVFVLSILGLGAISKVPAQEISQESKTAEVLQDNEWAYFTNMDERVFQIERLKRADAVNGEKTVVGSSRAMSVNSDMVGTPILNISVSGSSIEDLYTLGLSGVKVSKGSSILIGLDPWIINRNYEDNRWQSLRDEYVYWSSVVDNQLPLSSSQFFAADDKVARASLITKLYQEINIAKYSTIPRNGLPETVAKKSKEGSIIYGLEYATMSEREKRAGFPADLRYGGMAQFEVSQRNLVKIEKLIKYLQSNGIEVTLLLSPYHPDLFSDSAIQLRSINLAETSFRDMANETSAILLGSFDPKILKCEASEFYDGMHPKESCMRKTLEHQKVQRK
jgi:hypothetical protein